MKASGIALAGCLAFAGCAPLYFPHAALHPSRSVSQNSGGVAVGFMPFLDEDLRNRTDGVGFYGEGWGRLSLGPGQLELRLTPALGFVGYRVALLDDPAIPVKLSLQPSLGLGLTFANANLGGFGARQGTTVCLAPNITAIVSVLDGALYVAPRFGVSYVENPLNLASPQDSGVIAFGLNLGYSISLIELELPMDFSVELGWQRVAFTGAQLGSFHIITLSVGANFGTQPGLALVPLPASPAPAPAPAPASAAPAPAPAPAPAQGNEGRTYEDLQQQEGPALAPLPAKKGKN